jgi:peroxiredoxin
MSIIEGSEENDIAQDYRKTASEFRIENNALLEKLNLAKKNGDSVSLKLHSERINTIRQNYRDFNINHAYDNTNSIFSLLLLENLIRSKALTINEVDGIFKQYPDNLKKSAPGKRIEEKINVTLATEIGAIAPDFTAPDPDGKQISLNEIKGKVTIIDFWAAWCGPCRKENPNVVKLYEKYHDKGLEIIGVSLDGNSRQKDPKKAWLDAIEKDGIKWHQVSNLNYFRGPVAKQYNIQAIPATFILDSEGKIIAKNLRGSALAQKISELLD